MTAATEWVSMFLKPGNSGLYLVWVVDDGAGWTDQAIIDYYSAISDRWEGSAGIIEDGGVPTHWASIHQPKPDEVPA